MLLFIIMQLFIYISNNCRKASFVEHVRAMFKGMIQKMSTVQFVEDLVLVNTCLLNCLNY